MHVSDQAYNESSEKYARSNDDGQDFFSSEICAPQNRPGSPRFMQPQEAPTELADLSLDPGTLLNFLFPEENGDFNDPMTLEPMSAIEHICTI